MQASIKGVVVGFSLTLSIAVAMALSIAHGERTFTPLLGHPDAAEAAIGLIILGLPTATSVAIMLAGLETPGFGPRARTVIFVVVALLFLTLCLPFWPGLAACSVPLAIVHAIALARWTTPRVAALPRAVAL